MRRNNPQPSNSSNSNRNWQNRTPFHQSPFSNGAGGTEYNSYICPCCKNTFDCNERNKEVGKVPLILSCQHTVCRECILNKLLQADNVICCVCNVASELTKRSRLEDIFKPNYYLIGIILWTKPYNSNAFRMIPQNSNNLALVEAGSSSKKRSFSSEVENDDYAEKCCSVSCLKKAKMRCHECNDFYCTDCCTMFHKSAQSMWNHTTVPIKKTLSSLNLEECQVHTHAIQYFCIECNKECCVYCFMEYHDGHHRTPLIKLTDEESEELDTLKVKAEKVFKQLLITKNRLKHISNVTIPESDISTVFANLHAKLYTREFQLRQELALLNQDDQHFAKINSNLNSNINRLKQILVAIRAEDKKKINLKNLLEELRDVEHTPCFLLSHNHNPNRINFHVNPMFDDINEGFSLRSSDKGSFTLCNERELPEFYVPEKVEGFNVDMVFKELLNEGNKKQRRNSTASSSSSTKTRTKQTTEHHKANVTYIISMDCFYVTLSKSAHKYVTLQKNISTFMRTTPAKVETPKINEIYLALYVNNADKSWGRGRIADINYEDGKILCEVFFIDYGYRQFLGIDRLREISRPLSQAKPFALECKLYNPANAEWTSNAHLFLAKIINDREVYLVIKDEIDGKKIVDLNVDSTDGGLTSVIDILMFTVNNALMSSEENIPQSKNQPQMGSHLKIYENSKFFVKNHEDTVIIASVENPYKVYVHMASYRDMFNRMCDAMKEYFLGSGHLYCIPIENTFAIVEKVDEMRGNYHRALIVSVNLQYEQVRALLVDWGITVFVELKKIRSLTVAFTKLEAQAVPLRLADIAPFESQSEWSREANPFFTKYILSQLPLKMVVQTSNPLTVVLFEVKRNFDICLNAKLVEENLADSVGALSETLEWPRMGTEPMHADDDSGSVIASMLQNLDFESFAEDAGESTSLRCEVSIVKATRPDLIYLKFVDLTEVAQSLQNEMQVHYHDQRRETRSWSINDKCAVYYKMYKLYVRGKIVETVDADHFKVFLYDRAEEIIAPKTNLYYLQPYFENVQNVTFRCHLANIMPAGGSQWSLTAIETLHQISRKYHKIFITKLPCNGPGPNKSIPIELWYQHIIAGNALQPNQIKYISFNKLLIELGFAYKCVAQAPEVSSTENEPDTQSDLISMDISSNELNTSVVSSTELVLNAPIDEEAPVEEPPAEETFLMAATVKKEALSDDEDIKTEIKKELNYDTDTEEPELESAWGGQVKQELLDIKEDIHSDVDTDVEGDDNEVGSDNAQVEVEVEEADIKDWLPAESPLSKEFNAIVLVVNENGLYVRDESLEIAYGAIEKHLKEQFENNTRRSMHDWSDGDICTIFYQNLWYRGKVLQLQDDGSVQVVMVDFGSIHFLPIENLYREILFPNIPVLSSKITLHNVFPRNGVWDKEDYETLHKIISRNVKVIVQGDLNAPELEADVYTSLGMYVNQMIVDKCPNLTHSFEQVPEPAVVANPCIDNYHIMPLPKEICDGNMSYMSIFAVLSYDSIVINVFDEVYNKQLTTITAEMNSSAKNLPLLEAVEIGQPCVCPYDDDGEYYRARIHNIDGIELGVVNVFFVDYGNIENVKCADLKAMQPNWLQLPVQCYIARVNIKCTSPKHKQYLLSFMKHLENKAKLISVVQKEPLIVDVYERSRILSYDHYLKSGSVKKVI